MKTKYQRRLFPTISSVALLLVLPVIGLAGTGNNTNDGPGDLGSYGQGVDDFGLGGFALYTKHNGRFSSPTVGKSEMTAGAEHLNSQGIGGANTRSSGESRGYKSKP